MASVVLDITTRGLDDAIRNVQGAKNLVTAGTFVRMQRWYNTNMKKTMLNIIDTGEGVADNVGRYALEKESKYGISHGLGRLTGNLYFTIESSQPTIKETRGKEVRLAVNFDGLYYLVYVIDGTSNHVGRDFVLIARDKELPNLTKILGTMFDGLDFTRPYPELMRSIISYNGGAPGSVR